MKGWPLKCYVYSKENGGRLASSRDYYYTKKDGPCESNSKPDSMIAAKITGYTRVGKTEQANIEALATGSLSVTFEVTNTFQHYLKGIIQDNTCTGRPNHAVTAVGYTSKYILVKNSWGTNWGDKGFVKFARGYNSKCGLYNNGVYPTLVATWETDDNPSDKATEYRPNDDDDDEVTPCHDRAGNCKQSFCNMAHIADKYCRKTCNLCE